MVEQDTERVCLQGSSDVRFSGKQGYESSLVKAMIRVFAPYFVIGIFFVLLKDVLLFIQPYLTVIILTEHYFTTKTELTVGEHIQ